MIRELSVLLLSAISALAGYEPPAAKQTVASTRMEWRDQSRERGIPAKVYYSANLTSPCPVILFSHGLGGSCEGYEFVGKHWAGCGYVSVHLQHPGSDDAVWKQASFGQRFSSLRQAAMNPANAADRPRDVSFVIDQLTAANDDPKSPLHRRLDLQRIGVAGHSFGGFTTMAIAGQTLGLRADRSLADPRVKAVIQMSAPVPRDSARAYAEIRTPVFHMTGTKDDSPIGETAAAQRRIPFDRMTAAETCLLTFTDGDHMVFSGTRQGARDLTFQRHIREASTAWWDAWLRNDAAARTWLLNGGFERSLGTAGVFEVKPGAK